MIRNLGSFKRRVPYTMNTEDNSQLDADPESAPGNRLRKENWFAFLVGAAVISGGIAAAFKLSSGDRAGSRRPPENIVMCTIPPAVIVPPPVIRKPELEEVMTPVEEDEPEEPVQADPGATTGIVGDGPPDVYGQGYGRGQPPRPKIGAPGSGGGVITRYARAAAGRIADAVRQHKKLQQASLEVTVRIWVDSTGRVSRAESQSSGDATSDAALRNDVLVGLQLSGPPPEGMKMPVNLRLTAARPD